MIRTIALFTSTAIGCVAFGLSAQATPDFSGRWSSEPADSAPAVVAPPGPTVAPAGGAARPVRGDMGSGWGSTITIEQEAGRLTVEYVFFARGDLQPPLKFIYALDGSETQNTVMMGRGIQSQASRTAWVGPSLVITTTHSFTNPDTGKLGTIEVTQTLTLESPGALVVETTRGGALGGSLVTTRTVYRKDRP